ncbi:MAG: HEAT repeat domain-containing protein, partial [Deltaproteobacteria bacterium]|nr:HEAT repeat domain-containing protein [Deltaproteobacteria bacterium]
GPPLDEEERDLLARLGDADAEERAHAASLLGKRRCIAAFAPLVDALGDPHPDVRRYAADALERLGDRRAVAPLLKLLPDPDDWVRQWAAAALHRLGESPHRHGFSGPFTVHTEAGEELVVEEDAEQA